MKETIILLLTLYLTPLWGQDSMSSPLDLGSKSTSFIYSNTQNSSLFINHYVGRPSNDLFYKFTLTHTMDVIISHCGSKVNDTYLHLLQADGTRIAYNDDYSGEGQCENRLQSYLKQINLSPGIYYVVSEGYGQNGFITTTIQGIQYGGLVSSSDQNYILTVEPQIASSNISALSSDHAFQTIQYFDGLGRPTQLVQRGITPSKQDLVSWVEYDDFGRTSNSWLPTPHAGNGAYLSLNQAKSMAIDFYKDANPYSKPIYENSPLNRVIENVGAGVDWHSNGKSIKTTLLTNGTNGALFCALFSVDGSLEFPILKREGSYLPNELLVTKQSDEDDKVGYEFADKLGRLILVRQISYLGNHDTYYVYDQFGNLMFVLPPLAADNLSANTTWNEQNQTLKDYAYLYRYDYRNRCIQKRLPGMDWIKYVYDKADRLIFSQDGEQRKRNEWSYNKYDGLGRVLVSGIHTTTETHSTLIQKCANLVVVENRGPAYGYSWNCLPEITHEGALVVNYYDDYSFLLEQESLFKNELDYQEKPEYGICYIHPSLQKKTPKGLLVGTRVRVLNSPNELVTAFYYDERQRLVQKKSINHLGGVDSEYYAYNFVGQPTKKLSIHTATNKPSQTELYTYTYDHAGRSIETKHSLNNRAEVLLAYNEYDELGRLIRTTPIGDDIFTTNYTYNVRSWTTSISNNYVYFDQKIQYAGPGFSMFKPKYNGNVSGIISNDADQYEFEYDGLSQLTQANYTKIGARSDGGYSTAYSYDKHGNVKTIKRMSEMPTGRDNYIDDLTFDYSGNQLLKVEDKAPNVYYNPSEDFKNYTSQAVEYSFNLNGAMTKNLNKGISSIQYNVLNLPQTIEIKSPIAEAKNEYLYSALEEKLRVVQKWNRSYQSNPIIGTSVNNSLLTATKTTDYVGNKVYENGALKRILTQNGYIENGQYYFYIKDYLGNNRAVLTDNNTQQLTDFYPFGMAFLRNMDNEIQPYKFGAKEFDSMHGINQYDFHARQYDPAESRFTTVDPMTENSYSVSPYVYCKNNPVNRIDPDGMDDYSLDHKGYTKFIRETDDETHRLIALGKDGKINYDKNANMKNKSLTVEKSVLETKSTSSVVVPADNITYGYDIFQLRGDNKGTQLFEFVSQNTNVEWSLSRVGVAGDTGLNFITTSHQYGTEYGGGDLYAKQLSSYTYRENTHNHTNGSGPSHADVRLAKHFETKHPNTIFNVYIPTTRSYIRFSSKTEPWLLPEISVTAKAPKR